MPRPRPAQKAPRTAVEVATHKMCGEKIKCVRCQYIGPADIVVILNKRKDPRGMERCPACKSLNIICLEEDQFMNDEEISWECDEWRGCYPSDWRKKLVPGAMAHPAKFSSRLIRRIYEHLFEENWVEQGDSILDPFGGIALGALNAMEMGLRWTGVELEPKFVELGEHNISNWDAKFHSMPHWSGQAVLIQGDSRQLLKAVMGKQDSAVSSPPYADQEVAVESNDDWLPEKRKEKRLSFDWEGYGTTDGQLGAMKGDNFASAVSSPPYKNATEGQGLNVNKPTTFRGVLKDGSLSMGESEGNLGQMDDSHFDSAVSSPPFRQSEGGTPEPKPGGPIDVNLYARHAAGNSSAEGYGATEGQLANMKEGDFDGTVSSPPFENNLAAEFVDKDSRRKLAREKGISNAEHISPIDMEAIGGREQKDARYGFSDGQLGAESADDFWMAARTIVEQVFIALKPGGHATWVCKDFVRGGERVPFSDQWRQLCEAVGFTTLHEHHALLVVDKGKSMTLDGDSVQHKTSYKSFFRRLAEKNGSPNIDYETVWCMEKPNE